MSLGTVNVNGIVSGLQTDQIIEAITALARAPVTRLQQRKSALSGQISAWQQVSGLVTALRQVTGCKR